MQYKIILFIFFVSLFSNCLSLNWVAPENPKPQTIYTEAYEDSKNEKYEESLLKYIWIHEHSLEYRSGFVGVRNSYALEDWYKLGDQYPLAREKFHEYRNKAKQQVNTKNNVLQNFADFQAFNNIIGKQEETIKLFLWVEEHTPLIVDSVYIYAKKDLFTAGKYGIINKYINPNKDYNFAELSYISKTKFKKGPNDIRNETFFIDDINKIVTVLKNNNRLKEAENIISKALLLIKDPKFKPIIESILTDKK